MSEQSAISVSIWSDSKKFFFWFVLIYTFFYIVPFPLDALPHSDLILDYYQNINDHFICWAGKHIFHISGLKREVYSDSGDTTFDYASVLIFSILSTLLSLIILIIDRKRNDYEKLYYWLMTYIRYCIAFYMLVYGLDKVFKSHFPAPDLARLEQTYGNSSPQGLLWTCLGYSTFYTVFIGSMEVVSGLLLFFRRTAVFGIMVTIVILINVLIVNLSYDVPVKLFATHLLIYSLIILYPNLRSIFNFFFSGKNAAISNQFIYTIPAWLIRIRKILKPLIIIIFLLLFTRSSINNMKIFGDAAPKPPLYGIYKTELFMINKDTVPPLETDSIRWSEMLIDQRATILKTMNNTVKYYRTQTDTLNKTIDLKWFGDTTQYYHLKYENSNNYFIIKGNRGPNSLFVRFKKVDLNNFLLLNRGFHWINDYPLNR